MKLISMTDFVLEQINKAHDYKSFTERVENYAKFLKQPLKLEMFTTETIFEDISIDSYNKIFCGGYVGEIIKDKLFSTKKTIEDLTKNNIILNEATIKKIGL